MPPEYDQESVVPAGQPQPHVSIHLLKPDSMDLSGEGEEGEICFGGVMSSGYWQRADLTAQNFVEHPELGRLYRTGDLGQWRQHQLHVSGRIDRQVKVRGCRVELQELECALGAMAQLRESKHVGGLNGLDGLQECAAVVTATPSSHLQIVAFVCPATLDLEVVHKQAAERLSPQLLPSLFTSLPQLPRLANGKVDLMKLKTLASSALEKQETEVHAVLDSLGMLQHLTKSQIEEDRWVQNQQAFWTLVVMMEHFHLAGGADRSGPPFGSGDSVYQTFYVLVDICHCRDMVAFLLLLGFTDSRMEAPHLGRRDAAVVITAVAMTLVLRTNFGNGFPVMKVGPEWFLYTYFWTRLLLVGFCRHVRPGLWQAVFMFLMAMMPDDIFWLQLPMELRARLQENNPLDTKSLRFTALFLPACYLLSFHATQAGAVAWCKRSGQRLMAKLVEMTSLSQWNFELSLSVACFCQWLGLGLLCGRWPKWNLEHFEYQDGYQAVFVEVGDHAVSWHYMTHPSLLIYLATWIGEAMVLLLPGVLIALGMAYLPWHFKTMGSACFGIYVIHVPMSYQPWTQYFQAPILGRITSPAWGRFNTLIVVTYNVVFCLAFAHTIGVAFHLWLVATLARVARLLQGLHQESAKTDSDLERV